MHHYDAMGNRLRTTYYTRKVALVNPVFTTIPGTNNLQEYNIVSYTMLGNKRYVRYNHGSWALEYVYNPEGYIKYYGPEEHYSFYYIKDHLGNIHETYVYPWSNYKECIQRMQYYPSGLPWDTNYGASEQPFKYNSKEFVEMHGLDEYDSQARWYYPAIMRMFKGDAFIAAVYRFSLLHIAFLNVFANTTLYLRRPGDLLRAVFMVMVCYTLLYLWREKKWIPFAAMAFLNFYFIFYELIKVALAPSNLYFPQMYHTFLF